MAHRVAYYSRMEENPSWTPFHGGWEDRDDVLRVRFSYRGTDEHAHWHTLNRMFDEEGRGYYQGLKQESDGTQTIFMVEPMLMPLDAQIVTSSSNKKPKTGSDESSSHRRRSGTLTLLPRARMHREGFPRLSSSPCV